MKIWDIDYVEIYWFYKNIELFFCKDYFIYYCKNWMKCKVFLSYVIKFW